MKEHALPQDITSYRFHIIGNMTLKQFAEVGAGCVVGFLIYTTNLPNLIKWPLILISAGIGALAAFVPFEERPLDQWIVALFNALYRPTQFFWKKKNKIPEPFLFEPRKELHSVIKDVDLSPLRRQRVTEFLHSIETSENPDEVDSYHLQRIQEVSGALEGQEVGESQAADFPNAPVLASFPQDETNPPIQQFIQQQPVNTAGVAVPEIRSVGSAPQANTDITPEPAFTDFSVAATPQPLASAQPTAASQQNWQPTKTQADVVIPQNTNVQIASTYAQATMDQDQQLNQQLASPDAQTYLSADEQTSQAPSALPTDVVIQNARLPFPEKPTEPNKVVGMVLSPEDQPISNAIVEVVTPNGMPARAVKTNILGQFFIATPLNTGVYTLNIEKDGFQFSPQQLTINGQIIDPIEVRSLN
jgi:hypothetical protein